MRVLFGRVLRLALTWCGAWFAARYCFEWCLLTLAHSEVDLTGRVATTVAQGLANGLLLTCAAVLLILRLAPTLASSAATILRVMLDPFYEVQIYGVEGSLLNIEEAPSCWQNFGYWRDTSRFPQACANLALLLADAIDLRCGDTVVDCGFGNGDACALWHARTQATVYGLNNCLSQVKLAQERVRRTGFEQQVRLEYGDALMIDALLPDLASVDVVLSLDSAYHYRTRHDFLRRAYSRLTPGGRIALADMTVHPHMLQSRFRRMLVRIGALVVGVPMANLYDVETYAAIMRSIGFCNVKCVNISKDVFEPFSFFMRAHHEKLSSVIPSHHWSRFARLAQIASFVHRHHCLEFVVFSAEKPRSAKE